MLKFVFSILLIALFSSALQAQRINRNDTVIVDFCKNGKAFDFAKDDYEAFVLFKQDTFHARISKDTAFVPLIPERLIDEKYYLAFVCKKDTALSPHFSFNRERQLNPKPCICSSCGTIKENGKLKLVDIPIPCISYAQWYVGKKCVVEHKIGNPKDDPCIITKKITAFSNDSVVWTSTKCWFEK